MSRTLRFAIAALALTLAQTSAAATTQRPVSKERIKSESAERKRQNAAADTACPNKVAGSFTGRPPYKSDTRIAKFLAGVGDAAFGLAPKAKQSGTAR